MEIRTTYKGITKNGVKGIWCGFKPDDIKVTEELQILYPDKDMVLQDIATKETFTSVILGKESDKNNYEEIAEEKENTETEE